ncbi:MAG TPA: permease-like cell division protein FtsX [Candidatus Saccharimonadales bacterium]
MSAKTSNSSASQILRQKKQRRRQWLTTLRMVRYGINNFSRNAWLTIAATAVMTITLLIILITVAARNVLNDSLLAINDKVDISIFLKRDAQTSSIDEAKKEIENLSTVKSVRFVSAEEYRSEFAKDNKRDPDTLQALNVANTDAFLPLFRVKLDNIEQVDELKEYTRTDDTIKAILDEKRKSSLEEDGGGEVVKRIGSWVGFAANAGVIVATVFVILSMLIVFNTIRMAIFSRKEEIQMMKLIGADRKFIRGPFVVEAIVYGFIAALFSTGLGLLLLMLGGPALENFGIVIKPTLDIMTYYGVFVLLVMIVIGAIIGIISSLLAIRKYLKV